LFRTHHTVKLVAGDNMNEVDGEENADVDGGEESS
jgi:hypothetical protein